MITGKCKDRLIHWDVGKGRAGKSETKNPENNLFLPKC